MGDSVLTAVGGLVGLVVGGIAGYNLGAEAIEYSRTLVENVDVVSHMITEHPNVAKYLSTLSGLFIGGLSGAIPGAIYETLTE